MNRSFFYPNNKFTLPYQDHSFHTSLPSLLSKGVLSSNDPTLKVRTIKKFTRCLFYVGKNSIKKVVLWTMKLVDGITLWGEGSFIHILLDCYGRPPEDPLTHFIGDGRPEVRNHLDSVVGPEYRTYGVTPNSRP